MPRPAALQRRPARQRALPLREHRHVRGAPVRLPAALGAATAAALTASPVRSARPAAAVAECAAACARGVRAAPPHVTPAPARVPRLVAVSPCDAPRRSRDANRAPRHRGRVGQRRRLSRGADSPAQSHHRRRAHRRRATREAPPADADVRSTSDAVAAVSASAAAATGVSAATSATADGTTEPSAAHRLCYRLEHDRRLLLQVRLDTPQLHRRRRVLRPAHGGSDARHVPDVHGKRSGDPQRPGRLERGCVDWRWRSRCRLVVVFRWSDVALDRRFVDGRRDLGAAHLVVPVHVALERRLGDRRLEWRAQRDERGSLPAALFVEPSLRDLGSVSMQRSARDDMQLRSARTTEPAPRCAAVAAAGSFYASDAPTPVADSASVPPAIPASVAAAKPLSS